MKVINNIYCTKTNPQFGCLEPLDKAARKALIKGFQNRGEIREYVNLKNKLKNNPNSVRVQYDKSKNRLFGEIWQENSSFITFADFQEKGVKVLEFIKNLFNRA